MLFIGCWTMAGQTLSPSQLRHRPAPVEVPDTVATEAEERQAGAHSLLAAQASDRLDAKVSEVAPYSTWPAAILSSISIMKPAFPSRSCQIIQMSGTISTCIASWFASQV